MLERKKLERTGRKQEGKEIMTGAPLGAVNSVSAGASLRCRKSCLPWLESEHGK